MLSVDAKNSLKEATETYYNQVGDIADYLLGRGINGEAARIHRLGSGNGECDENWTEGFYGNGRPRKQLTSRTSVTASRWVYTQHNNISLDDICGLVVRHTCDNGKCVNPEHLVIGTQYDNVQDSIERERHTRGVFHGMSKLTEENIRYIRKNYVRGYGRNKPGNGIILREMFNISQRTLSDIVLRKKWKHVID